MTTPKTVDADKTVAEQTAKTRKPRERKEPTLTPEGKPAVKANLDGIKTKKELREIARKEDRNLLAVSYMSVREGKAWMKNEYPIELRGLNAPEVTVNDEAELMDHLAVRYRNFQELESKRGPERRALREKALGELAESGLTPPELVEARLKDAKLLKPVDAEPIQVERFVDIDGSGQRKRCYRFVESTDLKADGKPKAAAQFIEISPQAWAEWIKGTPSLEAKFDVPEGFNAPKVKEPKEKKLPVPKATKGATKTAKPKASKAKAKKDAPAPEVEEGAPLDIPEDL